MKTSFLLLFILFVVIFSARSNNVQVSNLSITGQNYFQHYCLVEFDLSWENSWRNDSTPPFNWDAAWVFIKYKSLAGEWHHATLSNEGHSSPDSATITSSGDNKGVFIYRAFEGHGNVNWANVQLRWNYGTDNIPDDAAIDIAVYAIEMVYVPEGNFRLGDGDGTFVMSSNSFYSITPFNTAALISAAYTSVRTYPFNGYDAIYAYGSGFGIDGDDGIDTTLDQTIDCPNYPTGYKAFYCMKYEISQEQYRDFLNSLTRTQQNKRVWSDISGTSTDTVYVLSKMMFAYYNQSICIDSVFSQNRPIKFYCELNKVSTYPPSFDPDSIDDGQTYACNYLTWMDATAYADWAGLRPMTEMEYEKACRGPNPSLVGEFAWGTSTIYQSSFSYNYTHHGYYDQIITNPGDSIGNANHVFSSAQGPLRNGIFAASSANHLKIEAGSSYYGIMEMTGNLWEMTVHGGNNAGLTFTGLHGNGELNSSGDADVDFWPGIGGNNDPALASSSYSGIGVTGSGGAGRRGGGCASFSNELTISARAFAGTGQQPRMHYDSNGFRAVRSAPAE
jgi:formylglycine-generating enzyme required for sulfatase activity